MKYTNAVALMVTICLACQPEKHMDPNDILGDWRLVATDQINYPSVSFSRDSLAVFTSRADTIYRYQYFIKSDSLMLVDIDGKQNGFKVMKLTKSDMTFDGLPGIGGKQEYRR